MSKYLLSVLVLLVGANLNAQQDKNTSEQSVVLQDSLLKISLHQSRQNMLQLIEQQKGRIQINEPAYSSAINHGFLESIYFNDTGFVFICKDNRKFMVEFEEMIDFKYKVYEVSNVSSGVQEYKMPLGRIILSVAFDKHPLQILRSKFIDMQSIANELHFKFPAFQAHAATSSGIMHDEATLPEEVRKQIVLAETFTRLYEYDKAILANYRIIALSDTVYPDAYFNVAILLAETGRLRSAICNMQKYLLLKPGGKDEKYCREKMEEWTIILNN